MTFELKFLVDEVVAERISDWARLHLLPDKHGAGPWNDEYNTATLYWDTARLDVLERRGSYGLAKYRVRRYGSAETVFLERKLRRSSRVTKRRSMVALDHLPRLLSSELAPSSWVGSWFQRRLRARRLRPTCQLNYSRVARYASSHGSPRLTVDRRLAASIVASPIFAADPGVPILSDRCIVELKYQHAVPLIFKQLLEQFPLTPATVSKYRQAMAVLGRGVAG